MAKKPNSPAASKSANKAVAKPGAAKSQKQRNYKKYASQKAANKTKAKRAAADASKGAWETVKIAGNLLTDDGGGLEGLIGLEVLEDYGAAVVKTGGKRTYSENDIDENFALPTKAERKQKRAEYAEKEALRSEAKKAKTNPKKTAAAKVVARKDSDVSDDDDDDDQDENDASESDEDAEVDDESEDVPGDNAEESDAQSAASSDTDEQFFDENDVSDIEMEDSDSEEPLTAADLTEWQQLGVHELILRALAEKRFRQPTQIQALTLPAAIAGRKDILGAAETGSGKTLAFGIPILNGILQLKEQRASGVRAPETSSKRKAQAKRSKPTTADAVDEEPTGTGGKRKPKRKPLPRKGERDNMTPPPEELLFAPVGEFIEQDIVRSAADSDDDQDDDEHDDQNGSSDAAHDRPLYALVLTPTRELCVQVKDHLVAAARHTGIQVAAIFGGLAHVKQERVLRRCPEIVVATPGRLWELISSGNEHLNKLRDISFLVIDETDRMVEKGHFEELKLLVAKLNVDARRRALRQNFVFSATLTMVHELPGYVKGKKQKQAQQTAGQKIAALIEQLGIVQPKVVDITSTAGTAKRLTECRIVCELAQKDWYLYYFLQRHPGRTIVFCNSIDCVKRLSQLFTLLDCVPRALHAHMNQRQRLKNLERFTASESGLLIATDVAARGLDIPNVRHVIHYQVPRTSENYVHRSGRTARAAQEGISVMMMEPAEVRDYLKLCRTLKRSEFDGDLSD